MWTHEQDRVREDEALRRAARYEKTGSWRHADEPPPPDFPPLELVTGRLDAAWRDRAWSKAKVAVVHNPDLALFGGWRLGDWKRSRR